MKSLPVAERARVILGELNDFLVRDEAVTDRGELCMHLTYILLAQGVQLTGVDIRNTY